MIWPAISTRSAVTGRMLASSGGAVAALAFAARHPDKASTVIAHEPPVTELLPDARHVRTAVDDIDDAYRAYGSGAAWGKFVSLVMHDGPVPGGSAAAAWPPPGSDGAETQTQGSADSEGVKNLRQRASEKQPGRR